MGVTDFSQYLNQITSPGTAVEGNVVKIIADNGTEVGDAVFKVIEGGNGTAAEVGVGVAGATGGGTIATGLSYLTMDLPTVFAAIAPALGVAAGVGIYELVSGDTDFHNRLLNALYEEGQTLGGKIIAFWNGDNLFFSKSTIEKIKAALLEADVFKDNYEFPESTGNISITYAGDDRSITASDYNKLHKFVGFAPIYRLSDETIIPIAKAIIEDPDTHEMYPGSPFFSCGYYNDVRADWYQSCDVSSFATENKYYFIHYYDAGGNECAVSSAPATKVVCNGETKYIIQDNRPAEVSTNPSLYNYFKNYLDKILTPVNYDQSSNYASHFFFDEIPNEFVQPDATYPTSSPFPLTYPDWYPLEYPQTIADPSELPDVYPVKYPGIGPDPLPKQDPAQNPQPEPVPEAYPKVIPDFDLPQPGVPEPAPTPDPDPQPDPDPIPEPGEPDVPSDPVDPNTPPTPSVPIVIPPLPDTVNSSKLFTVYNPTSSQLDALGGYLWDGSIIAAIRDIWQEPMDGLISLQQIYVTPPTGGSHNIILGFLDSGVPSAVVSNQFVTIDCGTVSVPEDKGNCTDYAPYTSLHLYLPFVGIVELDTNECMNSDISVKYKVDVYTGTCLAQVSVEREADMPNDPILYTFSGNCSQQIPLTSGNATGMLSALVGAISTGISVASGGGLSTLAGAQLLGNSLTHEMMHVSHSGNISANAGIMGQKKPYLIIGRRHNYDANSYNSYYGFPANKTVVLGNHSGFVRMKSGYVKTTAMKEEYEEIMRLLEDGVFL